MNKAMAIWTTVIMVIVALAVATPLTHSSQPTHHSVASVEVDRTAQFFPLEQRYTTWVYTEAGWQHSSVTLY